MRHFLKTEYHLRNYNDIVLEAFWAVNVRESRETGLILYVRFPLVREGRRDILKTLSSADGSILKTPQ